MFIYHHLLHTLYLYIYIYIYIYKNVVHTYSIFTEIHNTLIDHTVVYHIRILRSLWSSGP